MQSELLKRYYFDITLTGSCWICWCTWKQRTPGNEGMEKLEKLCFFEFVIRILFLHLKLPGRDRSWMGDYAIIHVVAAILRTPRDSR